MDEHVTEPDPDSPAGPFGAPEPPLAELPSSEDRNLAVLAHLGGIFTSFGVPLVVWLSRRGTSPFLEDQAREALNFQITMLGIYFATGLLVLACIGLPLFTVAFMINAVLAVLAAMGAREGKRHRYPFALRLIS